MSGSFRKIKIKLNNFSYFHVFGRNALLPSGGNHRIFFPLSENRATVPGSVHHALLLKLEQGLVSVSKEEMLNGLLDDHNA